MTMICDLPNDMESEILSRVPAKALWRLKTTCKRWYALLRDPKFVVKNRKLGRAIRESILLTNHGDIFSVAGDLHNTGVTTPINVSGKLTSIKGSKDLDFAEIFHCDGLMLCYAHGNPRLVVWNPCTGQTRNIEASTCFETSETYALGYSRSSSSSSGCSYKILRCFDYQNDEEVWVTQCDIYELRSDDSWRVLDSLPFEYIMLRNGVSLKGDTYWVVRDGESGYFMMKFDFTAERFVRLPLPFQSFYLYNEAVLSVVRDEKLSVMQIYDTSDEWSYAISHAMRIWVSNKIDEDADKDLSWRSDVEVDDYDAFNLIFRSFLLDEGNKVAALCCNIQLVGGDFTTMIYIIGEAMRKQVYIGSIKATSPTSSLVITYVPSLVRI